MPSRRLDAELVRDNLLWVAGDLDLTMGGPEIDNQLGLTSRRRSIYLRIAAEKEVEFLKIFDGPAVTECYQRHTTVMPQQALALGNSKIALAQARSLSTKLSDSDSDDFITAAFERILARLPTEDEHAACADFLYQNGGARLPSQSGARPSREVANPNLSSKLPPSQSARENLILVLLNHNDFVTIR